MKLEKPEMIVREEKDCLFVEHIGAYNAANCGDVWQTLWKYVEENNLCNQQTEVIGLALDDPDITKPENCRYDACITVDKPMISTLLILILERTNMLPIIHPGCSRIFCCGLCNKKITSHTTLKGSI